MEFSVVSTFGNDLVRAGVRAILGTALPGYREESDLSRAETIVRGGADLSDPAALAWGQSLAANRHFVELSAGMTGLPGSESTALRELSSRWRLVTVQDRFARDVLADTGTDAPLLPCAAFHAWRLHAAPADACDGRVAVGAGLGELGRLVAAALRTRGLQPVLIAHDSHERDAATALLPAETVLFSTDWTDYFAFYGQCAGGITDRAEAAFLLAGRGAPAIAVGEDTRVRILDEVMLPRYSGAQASADTLVARLCSMTGDGGTTRHRLVALEQRSFRTHSEAVRKALGKPGAADALEMHLAAIRRRFSAEADRSSPPARERWIDPQPLLGLEGEEFVREAYLLLLGREPEPEGLRHWVAVLVQGTAKQQLLTELAGSSEAKSRGTRLLTSADFLDGISFGNMSQESRARWLELLESGTLPRDDAARLIASSGGVDRTVAAVAEMRRELEWHRRAIEWLLRTRL